MPINAIDSAQNVFDEAFAALMAHTIRGVQNKFLKSRIELSVSVRPDLYGFLQLKDPKKKQGATSVLMTRLIKKVRAEDKDRLYAVIYIHAYANKPLARICIAHEMYHLLLELDEFLTKRTGNWPTIAPCKIMEDTCNQFAWELCFKHDKFNRDEKLRQKHIIFPDGTFSDTFKMNDHTDWVSKWPNGIALDPQNPFYKSKLI